MKKQTLRVASKSFGTLLMALAIFSANAQAQKTTAKNTDKQTDKIDLSRLTWDGTKMVDTVAVKKEKKAQQLRLAKKQAAAAAARKPASIEVPEPELQVFDIATGFEEMLKERAKYERAPAALSPMARVIGVRRDLGLNDAESMQASRDIVLNGGTGAGLSEGMVLSVVRKIPVIDPYQANQQSELEVEFAKVKIVHAQSDVAVARLESIESIDSGMAIGTRTVLVGDFVTQGKK